MNEFIEQNKRLLRSYCVVAQIIGWVLLIVPAIASVVENLGISTTGEPMFILYAVLALLSNYMLLGVVVLGVAQFMRYLFETRYQPGWILRYGDKILYVYAAFLIADSVAQYCFHAPRMQLASFSLLLYLVSLILHAIVKVLILTGLGQILRRIMPVIEESRMLV